MKDEFCPFTFHLPPSAFILPFGGTLADLPPSKVGRVDHSVILAERLANEIEASISQVAEPYRSRLLAWIEGQMGKPVQNDNLSCWLHGFDAISMIDQYELLQIVCGDAARIFRDNKSERGKSSG